MSDKAMKFKNSSFTCRRQLCLAIKLAKVKKTKHCTSSLKVNSYEESPTLWNGEHFESSRFLLELAVWLGQKRGFLSVMWPKIQRLFKPTFRVPLQWWLRFINQYARWVSLYCNSPSTRFYSRVARQKPFLTQRQIIACLKLAKTTLKDLRARGKLFSGS